MKTERRQSVRYQVINHAYAALGRNYSKVGRIRNISSGGLAFDYNSDEVKKQNALVIDIFTEDGLFGLYELPCTLAFDEIIKTPKVRNQFMDLLTIRRCGVKFGRLEKEEANQLAKFISVHTTKFAK